MQPSSSESASPQPEVAAGAATAAPQASPTLSWRAAIAMRDELRSQLRGLVEQRHSIVREIEDHGEVSGPATAGMQQRIVELDARIAELDKAIATADAQVARAASVPGAVVIQPPPIQRGPPEEAYIVGPIMLMIAILPLSIALARRLWKRGSAAVQQLPHDLMDRLARIEQMGEATALEVERIGEGQRFVTRLLTERGEKVLVEGSAPAANRPGM